MAAGAEVLGLRAPVLQRAAVRQLAQHKIQAIAFAQQALAVGIPKGLRQAGRLEQKTLEQLHQRITLPQNQRRR